ncbi:MAG: LacI family DNA-binding transcriptional regulator [Rhodobacteraceae bacterium]|nr:MAG: LacI family DNA-binding transcriptional regulator [Paracoccaceae bacterium]
MAAVGRIAGVSQVTVSRALSDPSKVSPETLRRIRDAIEATGFVPNAIAGALASQRSNLVTALIPSIINITYSAFIRTFSQRMREAGYQILLSETGFDPAEEESVIAAHLSRRPDAMLLTGIHHSARAKRQLLGAGIPVVEVWDITDTPIDLCVGFSHPEAARAVADHLVARGHRAAATVTASDERAGRRRDAFAARFTALTGHPVPDHDTRGPASIGAGRAGLAALLDNEAFRAGVVFCSSDLLAHGIMIEARARGLRVPRDIAVMGFGDQDFARVLDPPLTTVRIDRDRLGQVAADALLGRIACREDGQAISDIGFRIIDRGTA